MENILKIIVYSGILLFLILLFNKIYFIKKKEIHFYNYTINFIYYSLIFFLIYLLVSKIGITNLGNDEITGFIIIYTLFFISFLLTIGLKFIESPTEIILEIIKEKKNYNQIVSKLKKKQIIKLRIKDLINQKIIKKRKQYLILTKSGMVFASFIFKIKKLYKLNISG